MKTLTPNLLPCVSRTGADSPFFQDGVPEAELPYAAANIYKPPGGENPVAELDEQVALAEQLRSPGGQQALEEAIEYLERV